MHIETNDTVIHENVHMGSAIKFIINITYSKHLWSKQLKTLTDDGDEVWDINNNPIILCITLLHVDAHTSTPSEILRQGIII